MSDKNRHDEEGQKGRLAGGPGAGAAAAAASAVVLDGVCQFCEFRPAEIFQATGQFCIECWQELTYPDV